MKLYAVSQGEYSDYEIFGIFDSREKAQNFIEYFSTKHVYEFNDIEEYELNPFELEMKNGLKYCTIKINKQGDTKDFNFCDTYKALYCKPIYEVGGYVEISCWAKDEAHAIKIASEKRAELIAEGIL